jgi:hypothetical protein
MQYRLSRIVSLLALAVSLTSGCIFSPERKPPKQKIPFTYLAPIGPRNVLQNLVSAYINRDSVETRAVYDFDYKGYGYDPSLPTPNVQFTNLDEIYHVKFLHDDPNIVSVLLDLGQPSTWQVLPGSATDDPGTMVIPIQFHNLRIDDVSTGGGYELTVDSQIEFAFKPKEIAAGDTTWTVIRWTERFTAH